jgi:NAD(P)-dependent dehydrogenase (short-subunit alcohol dehydrogenase family)
VKTAFITGGSSDIGQAVAARLAEHSWEIIAPSHKELDLSKLDTIAHKVDKGTRHAQVIDAVIHIAGIWHDSQSVYRKDLEDYTVQQIADAMNVGLTGFMLCLRTLLPKMPKDGTVIGISGTFADGASGWLPYYTSKRGLEDLLVGLAQDYPSGPRAYGISPADTATRPFQKFFPEYVSDAQPAESVAQEVLQLLSNDLVPSGSVVELRRSVSRPGFHK